jgi:hypothetical protein
MPSPFEEPLYIVSDVGFRFPLPASWADKYYVADLDNGFIVRHKETYDIDANMGELFRVQRIADALPDEWVTDNLIRSTFFAADDYYIAFTIPSDVQCLDETNERYYELAGQVYNIKRGLEPVLQEISAAAGYNISPELVAASGMNGITGYLYQRDIDADSPNNPEEAVEYMKRLEELNEQGIFSKFIPLYGSDGFTVIGEFEVSIDVRGWSRRNDSARYGLGSYIADGGLSRVVLQENNRFTVEGRPEISYMPTGSYEIDGNKLYLNVSEEQQFIFSIYGNILIFESGEWLENWISKETVFILLEDEQ